jgi:hypothetical protein
MSMRFVGANRVRYMLASVGLFAVMIAVVALSLAKASREEAGLTPDLDDSNLVGEASGTGIEPAAHSVPSLVQHISLPPNRPARQVLDHAASAALTSSDISAANRAEGMRDVLRDRAKVLVRDEAVAGRRR